MRVLLFALLLVAVVAAHVGTVAAAPSEEVHYDTSAPSTAAPSEEVHYETSTPSTETHEEGPLFDDRSKREKICEPGTKYLIWGVKCVCAVDGKGLDCDGVGSL